jgi:hypothetical protein
MNITLSQSIPPSLSSNESSNIPTNAMHMNRIQENLDQYQYCHYQSQIQKKCRHEYNYISNHQQRHQFAVVRFSEEDDEICTIPSPLNHLETEQEWYSLWYSSNELNQMKNAVRAFCLKIRNERQDFPFERSNNLEEKDEQTKNDNDLMKCEPDDNQNEIKEEKSAQDLSIPNVIVNVNDLNKKKNKKKPMMALDSKSRGLEPRICIERQRRRFISTRYVVKLSSQILKQQEQFKSYNDYVHYYNDNHRSFCEKLANVSMKLTRWATQLAIMEASRDYIRAYGNDENSISSGLFAESFMNKCCHTSQQINRDNNIYNNETNGSITALTTNIRMQI